MARSRWKRMWLGVGCAGVLCAAFAGWVWQDLQRWRETPLRAPDTGQLFVIAAGSGFTDILRDLHTQGLLRDLPWHVRHIARGHKDVRRIQAGEYRLRPDMKPEDALALFVRGEVVQHHLTLVEGWSFREVMRAVSSHPALSRTLPDQEPRTVLRAINTPWPSAEGLFLAETWHFTRGTRDIDFLRRAHQGLLSLLQREWSQRQADLPYASSYEALVMASLIEKETGRAEERAHIAGVFVRRLRLGMRLQTDPTVIFALGDRYDGNIRKRDLSVDSPYNTYRYPGLPPGAIALVGEEALRAALRPEDGDSLYFVAKGDGSHHFSATLREHNRAVDKYQRKNQ